jgi:predicted GNAT family acetyltransferase
MQFRLYTDVHEFYEVAYEVLMRHEAQNMIILGNLIIGHGGKDKTGWRDTANWLMATVSDESGVLITALMTPPYNVTLYATDNIITPQAVDCLIEGLIDYNIPGVMTEKTLAEYFAKEYTARKGLTYTTTMDQRIYELAKVNPDIKRFGVVRLLEEKDMYFFPYWFEAFNAAKVYGNTEMFIPQDEEKYRYHISTKKIYVLEVDGIPVSMAGYTREMQTAIGVAYVYTPPYFRGKGYATSCVAQLSQMALDRGYTRCVLYTDLLNPTSNSIYQKIGYKPVCDSLMLKFE